MTVVLDGKHLRRGEPAANRRCAWLHRSTVSHARIDAGNHLHPQDRRAGALHLHLRMRSSSQHLASRRPLPRPTSKGCTSSSGNSMHLTHNSSSDNNMNSNSTWLLAAVASTST